jgi:hypothetical protein
MDDLFKCKCGCDHFVDFTPHQYRRRDVDGWTQNRPNAVAGVASVLMCISCSRLTLSAINFAGKSVVDPNVQAYASLMQWVDKYNAELEKHNTSHLPIISTLGSVWSSGGEGIGVDGMAKSDKVSMPSKQETFGPSKQGSMEPRTTEKPNKSKTKKVKVQKTKSTTSKDDTNI